MARGPAEHHLHPGLHQRRHRNPAAVAVAAAGHRRARRGLQVARPAGHHRVHAAARRPARPGVLQPEAARSVLQLAERPRVRDPRSGHPQHEEDCTDIRHAVGRNEHY
uniref:(northern house mosquito) hypothetical protein n=1 Tax=Culex pipiens TaxID=7175 RepID=A0A8D8HQN4_CULPI